MAVNLLFQTATMKLTDNLGNTIDGGASLACQLDTVNIPIQLEVQGSIPVDYFMLYSIGWISPVPARGQYLVDLATGAQYSVYGRTAEYQDHLEVQVSLPLGAIP